MKKSLRIVHREVQFYSINLCSHDDVGDYELFPVEKVKINIRKIIERLHDKADVKWSSMAAQFTYKKIRISIYTEGRVILEGVKPDSHEEAFRFLEELLY